MGTLLTSMPVLMQIHVNEALLPMLLYLYSMQPCLHGFQATLHEMCFGIPLEDNPLSDNDSTLEDCWPAFQVKFIPDMDLRAIDGLWRAASNGKFGYSVQKELWVQNRRYWERLFKVIDWTHGTHNYYR